MPLPLIPAIILGASAASAVKGAIDVATSTRHITQAKHRYARRRELYEQAEATYLEHQKTTIACLNTLGETRLHAMQTLGQAVTFLERARVTTTPVLDDLEVTHEELEQWRGLALQATAILGGIVSSVGAGASTAVSAYALVGAIGVASTGTAIGSLSGVAATNATLAWFGGGAIAAGGGGMALGTVVLGGVVAGPAVLVSGFFLAAHAEKVKTEVAKHIAEMDVAQAQMKRNRDTLTAICVRAEELQHNVLRLAEQVETFISIADSTRLEDLYQVAQLAKALAHTLTITALPTTQE